MSLGRANNTLPHAIGGSEVIDDTSAHTGLWGEIQVINDAVISSITMPKVTNSAGYQSITLPAGMVIYGEVTAITLTSGVVAAHNI